MRDKLAEMNPANERQSGVVNDIALRGFEIIYIMRMAHRESAISRSVFDQSVASRDGTQTLRGPTPTIEWHSSAGEPCRRVQQTSSSYWCHRCHAQSALPWVARGGWRGLGANGSGVLTSAAEWREAHRSNRSVGATDAGAPSQEYWECTKVCALQNTGKPNIRARQIEEHIRRGHLRRLCEYGRRHRSRWCGWRARTR